MKTLFLFDRCGEEELCFFEKEGDFSHLNGVYINLSIKEKEQEELTAILYDEEGNLIPKTFKEPTKDWDHFVIVGFVP